MRNDGGIAGAHTRVRETDAGLVTDAEIRESDARDNEEDRNVSRDAGRVNAIRAT